MKEKAKGEGSALRLSTTSSDGTPPSNAAPGGAVRPSALEVAAQHAGARKLTALLVRWGVYLGAAISTAFLLFIIGYILMMGIPHIRPAMFSWTYNSVNVSLTPALINTILMVLVSLAMATPLGLFAAIYLVEYTKRGNRLVKVIRLMAETLSGIPSIVYGLFGMLLFVTTFRWGLSLMAGACTLAIMVLPVIMRTSEEALKAVPDSYREGSFGLGAGRLRTVFKVIVPSAMPGILAGIILSIGRVVGETAALMFTAGTVAEVPTSAFDSTRTLAVHMYVLASEGLHLNEAYATAVVLLVIVVLINTASAALARKMTKGQSGG
ncbi:MAG: phosphate ABC transporter permease PstA [Coriobacteriales bacterium]|jgi:phosphate transport system permease protein|nr:phosphate ABC transporter permease PstA [Coriobacteriales bacterium]